MTSIQSLKPNFALFCCGAALALAQSAGAAAICVNPAGTGGCYTTISQAVKAAPSGAAIQVGPGVYKETVTITQPVSLIGAGASNTVIDATGQSNGIFVNGMTAPPNDGIGSVAISGFTIKNANFEGILVANALGVTISNNVVSNNDKSLQFGATNPCPNLPAFETNEGDDCGEGIHLMAVDHSIVANNIVEFNAGGILLSDETGPTDDNIISGNTVAENAYDCGITLASHGAAPSLASVAKGSSFGVYRNTISRNTVSHNGSLGQGAGIGIYSPGPGATASGNMVLENSLVNNGLGGVTMHNHAAPGVGGVPAQAPGVNFADNMIIGNTFSGNSGDFDDPMSPGDTGISIGSFVAMPGTVIAENTFTTELAGIVFNAPGGTIAAHLNNFVGLSTGIFTEGGGGVDASQNYWGCADGPTAGTCSATTGPYIFVPTWLSAPFGASGQQRR